MPLLETLFSAAAEAIIGKALDIALAPFGLDERLTRLIKGDPAKVAFQTALARSYTAFVRSYPQIKTQFFTEPFLAKEAAEELAHLMIGREPDATRFAELWVQTPRHHVTSHELIAADGKPTKLIVDASQYFLNLLRTELRHSEVFRPFFDSEVLDHLPEIAHSLDAMSKTLQQALKEAEGYARIQGDVSISGGDFVARDQNNIHNYYLSGSYLRLKDFWRPPDYIFEKVHIEDFVGRKQLQQRIHDFIHEEGRSNGLLLVEGEAGLGKTALMAYLVHRHGYFHVFGDLFSGEGARIDAIRHLAAQIVSRFQLEDYQDAISTESAQIRTFLQRVLEAAADKLSYSERIVLVYDALDQAGLPNQDHNPFGLPMMLPKGVFVIASQRPVQPPPKCDVLRETIKLEASDANNLDDVREFLRLKVTRDRKIALKLGPYSAEDYVGILSARASGNWMYLYYVLAEIERGSRGNPLALDKLPSGLNAYYCEYWQHWRKEAFWRSVYAPILGILGAVDEPVSLTQIVNWTGLHVQQAIIEDLLTSHWRAFVTKQRQQNEVDGNVSTEFRYQFVHRSLTRFMQGDVGGGLGEQEQSLVDALADQTKLGHQAIVDYFHGQCNGAWHKLVVSSYARRNLTRHLFEVDRKTLFEMVAMSDSWAKAREQQEDSYAGYLVDLDYAWRFADRDEWQGLGNQIRCALIKSSIHALASNLPPELLKLLIETRLWGPLKVFEHALQISDKNQREQAIVDTFPLLPDHMKSEALQAARDIQDEDSRARALMGLAPHLDAVQKSEALQIAKDIQGEYPRARALTGLAPHLDAVQKSKALQIAKGIQGEYYRASVLTDLAPHLDAVQKSEALQIARDIQDEDSRARVLTGLAPHLDDAQKSEAVSLALQAAKDIQSEYPRASALTDLAPHLDAAQKSEALQIAKDIQDEDSRARALTGLAPHLDAAQKSKALQIAKDIQGEYPRASTLTDLAPHLDAAQKSEAVSLALQAAKDIQGENSRASALTDLAPHLDDAQKSEALQIAKHIQGEYSRASTLTDLAPHLDDAQKSEALQAAKHIQGEYPRTRALTGLAPHLDAAQKSEAVNLALQAAKDIQDEDSRARALTSLAPHLDDVQKSKALQIAKGIQDEGCRARALTGLAPHLDAAQKSEVSGTE